MPQALFKCVSPAELQQNLTPFRRIRESHYGVLNFRLRALTVKTLYYFPHDNDCRVPFEDVKAGMAGVEGRPELQAIANAWSPVRRSTQH